MIAIFSDEELMHYGVPGMKWGVRKQEYKSMTRQQKRDQRKRYLSTTTRAYRYENAGKVKKILTSGGVMGTMSRGLAETHGVGKAYKKARTSKEYQEGIATAAKHDVILKKGMIRTTASDDASVWKGTGGYLKALGQVKMNQTKAVSSAGKDLVEAYINKDIDAYQRQHGLKRDIKRHGVVTTS